MLLNDRNAIGYLAYRAVWTSLGIRTNRLFNPSLPAVVVLNYALELKSRLTKTVGDMKLLTIKVLSHRF